MNIKNHTFVLPYYGLLTASLGLIVSIILWVPPAIVLCGAAAVVWALLSFFTHRALKQANNGPGDDKV
jgi:hypothetical protein